MTGASGCTSARGQGVGDPVGHPDGALPDLRPAGPAGDVGVGALDDDVVDPEHDLAQLGAQPAVGVGHEGLLADVWDVLAGGPRSGRDGLAADAVVVPDDLVRAGR